MMGPGPQARDVGDSFNWKKDDSDKTAIGQRFVPISITTTPVF